jgi:hypothetical protein
MINIKIKKYSYFLNEAIESALDSKKVIEKLNNKKELFAI